MVRQSRDNEMVGRSLAQRRVCILYGEPDGGCAISQLEYVGKIIVSNQKQTKELIFVCLIDCLCLPILLLFLYCLIKIFKVR